MNFDFEPPKNLAQLKKRAKQLRKTQGVKHYEALEMLARYCGFGSYREAQRALPAEPPARVTEADHGKA